MRGTINIVGFIGLLQRMLHRSTTPPDAQPSSANALPSARRIPGFDERRHRTIPKANNTARFPLAARKKPR
ncbi:hypothetical protein [Bosea sp. F3-2]|uniref:hypothetical protein n=1 Tax=Bosea sp. F3-2 TaxID=2599640 RepID=UPI001654D2C3|nr:hypothetical protein [Bosea sp. F3-2]